MHHGRSQVVLVESEPPGARILVGGEPVGVTPNFVELKRRHGMIALDRDGFRPEVIEVLGVAGPWVLAGTLGLDLATGAAWKLRGRPRSFEVAASRRRGRTVT